MKFRPLHDRVLVRRLEEDERSSGSRRAREFAFTAGPPAPSFPALPASPALPGRQRPSPGARSEPFRARFGKNFPMTLDFGRSSDYLLAVIGTH